MSDQSPGPGAWVRRTRDAPARIERGDRVLHELLELLQRDLHLTTFNDARLHTLSSDLREVLDRLHDLDAQGVGLGQQQAQHVRSLLGQFASIHRELMAPARDHAAAALIDRLGPSAPLVDGLSVLVTTWNHATRLPAAVTSALEVVPAEQVIVLDDASSDHTHEVLADFDGVRVIRSDDNLGLTRARNVLLHAVTTTRALFLDADNVLDAEAIGLLDACAVEWQATVAHGALLEVGHDGEVTGLLSAVPMDGAFFDMPHNLVDTLAIIDVEAVRAVGGYTLDPVLETSEDWDMWHRLASTGGLLLFVPTVVGNKLRSEVGHSAQPQDDEAQRAAITRRYRFDQRLDDDTVAAAVIHPATGPLWASTAAVRLRPALAEVLTEPYRAARLPTPRTIAPLPPSVLVVGGGGVRNLGDDVTVNETIRRLRSVLDPSVGIELVTDGDRPAGDNTPAVWLGTTAEFALRTLDHHLAVVMAGGGTIADEFAEATAQRNSLAFMARETGVPVLLTGQGLGPIDALPEAAELLAAAAAIGLRDPRSRELAIRLGIDDGRVTVLGDDAAREPEPTMRRSRELELVSAEGWLALNGRLAGYSAATSDELARWARAVDEAAAARGVDVVAVAMNRQPPWELETLSALAAEAVHAPWHVIDVTDDVELARVVFGDAQAVVTRSFHGAWFALEGGTPTLMPAAGAYYEAKAEGLRQLAELPDAFTDTKPPSDGASLERRWALVAAGAEKRPLAGVDAAITRWLVDQLRAVGVPLV